MFRVVLPLQLKRLSSTYHITSAVRTKSTRKFIPEDWYIVESGPGGGIELEICNRKTMELTWYIPEGMTAEEILAIPDAKKYWNTIEMVKEYMEEKETEKKANNGWDIMDEMRKNKTEWKDFITQMKPAPKFIPEDWYIVDTGPGGGIELDFCNSKTMEATWYTPEGMTAEEILAILDAKKNWSTVEEVNEYMEEKAAEKRESDGRDLIDELRELHDDWNEKKDS